MSHPKRRRGWKFRSVESGFTNLRRVEYEKAVPADCDIVIVSVNLNGLRPVQLLLPHQIYKEDMQKLLEEYPDAHSITVIPARAKDYITIWER